MILLTQEANHLHSLPEEAMEQYHFPHMVEFQTSAPHTGQEGQDENIAKGGRLGFLASSRHEPASHLPQVTSSLAGTWTSSAEKSLPPGIQGRGGHLPDGVPYKGDTKQCKDRKYKNLYKNKGNHKGEGKCI